MCISLSLSPYIYIYMSMVPAEAQRGDAHLRAGRASVVVVVAWGAYREACALKIVCATFDFGGAAWGSRPNKCHDPMPASVSVLG